MGCDTIEIEAIALAENGEADLTEAELLAPGDRERADSKRVTQKTRLSGDQCSES